MKNFKKLMMLAVLSISAQQAIMGYDKSADYDDSGEPAQPTHQGFGRLFTAPENILTGHPLNSVNALATGNQSDTTFGYHKDEDGKIKANRARTERNNNKKLSAKEKAKKAKMEKQQRQKKAQQKSKNKARSSKQKSASKKSSNKSMSN